MQVRDVMSAPPVFVYREAPLWRAARAMDQNGCGFVPVVHRGIAMGVVTSGDLARASTLHGRCPYSTPVSEVMSSPPVSVPDSADIREAMGLMHDRQLRRIVVVDEGGILRGVVSLGDLVGAANDDAVANTLHHLSQTSRPVPVGLGSSWQGFLLI